MKFYYLILILFVHLGCATDSSNKIAKALVYENLSSLSLNSSSEKQVIAIFGNPSSRSLKADIYSLNYDDPKTGFQRLSLNFLSSNAVLIGFLWIPQEGEKEFTLISAKSGFKNAKFKEAVENDSQKNLVFYVDESSGIRIQYDRDRKVVEAIAQYDSKLRSPTSQIKNP